MAQPDQRQPFPPRTRAWLCVVPFNFGYDVDVEKARGILLDIAENNFPKTRPRRNVPSPLSVAAASRSPSKSGAAITTPPPSSNTSSSGSRQTTLQSRRHRTQIDFLPTTAPSAAVPSRSNGQTHDGPSREIYYGITASISLSPQRGEGRVRGVERFTRRVRSSMGEVPDEDER